MRDLYLKAFEIAVKGAKMTVKYTFDDTGATATKVMRACTGIMPAQNCAPARPTRQPFPRGRSRSPHWQSCSMPCLPCTSGV